jgi:hypothetical protein
MKSWFASLCCCEVCAFLIVFISPLTAALISLLLLIGTDTFLGVWASWKKNGRKSITSRRFGRIITKIILYPLAVIIAKISQEYLAPLIPWVEVTTGIIATIEIKSIFEKMSILLGYDLWDRVKKAIWKDKKIE